MAYGRDYNVDLADESASAQSKLNAAGLINSTLSGKSSNLSTYNNEPLHSYAIVCNTDSSKGSGQHWFVIFISSDPKFNCKSEYLVF
jgi:hypothetical protein